ncbi:hypothetical protein SAMN05216371_8203 [Streptomyces sp. TLI_053]|uniref:hypothetical protein n=1 Tax=Streptomyces sp. TLI_053 TaxID=1855352 RepID=UPI00087DE420|nr:hypothetical protein [Streptomyces sp. TLI_053]SDT83380.1 hypothetical protein SAMN05216371_8203 [Streptomyces sp. TLI_053]
MQQNNNPFSALTGEAELYDLPGGDLDDILSPFALGLVMAAGRALAVLAYRDAAAQGDKPFDRQASGVAGTVLAMLPPACDDQDRTFRTGAARALWDLADDIAQGRAPLPRCTAERWALEVMLETAPTMFAATDDELHALGIAVPDMPDEHSYRPPYWDEAWQLVIEGAEFSIPEARPPADDGTESDEEQDVPEPAGGWSAPAYWASPYAITHPRDPQRGHPAWAQQHLDGAPLAAPAPLTAARAAELLRLEESGPRPGGAQQEDTERYFLAGVDDMLTPLAARILAAAADEITEQG